MPGTSWSFFLKIILISFDDNGDDNDDDIMIVLTITTLVIRDVVQKRTGKMWEFWKNGGGSTRIPLPFFTVFNTGDPPKKGPKMQNKP